MASCPCRCWRCWTRRTLPKPLSEYVRTPKCKICGTTLLFVCKDRLPSRWGHKRRCNCNGYYFPHRKGGGWCEHNPLIEERHQQQRRG